MKSRQLEGVNVRSTSSFAYTPSDMVVLNDLDRFHLVMDVIDRAKLETVGAHLLPPPDAPGRRYYSNLAYFLQCFGVPGGSSYAEKGLYLNLIARLDTTGILKPGACEKIESDWMDHQRTWKSSNGPGFHIQLCSRKSIAWAAGAEWRYWTARVSGLSECRSKDKVRRAFLDNSRSWQCGKSPVNLAVKVKAYLCK